ncbi:hypothetical protein EI982_14550 [Haloplanus rallus]|uniref:Uncharacterized protein n=1 Tax=Haloplanus rallus TaxID=1816183 RepID=A0A6B9F6A1_9EURY|nr:hypothetical protein [Haloplanus rallus]QGX95918.1 hypothetical protein EI982_14550 [Haloplanus rallus]
MSDNESRGQESPDRPTQRLCTDGGEERLTNSDLNDLVAGLTGEASFEIHTEHTSMDVDGFDIDVEMDLAIGDNQIWLVADSDAPRGEYAMILDAEDAAYLADVLARAAAEARERDDR